MAISTQKSLAGKKEGLDEMSLLTFEKKLHEEKAKVYGELTKELLALLTVVETADKRNMVPKRKE